MGKPIKSVTIVGGGTAGWLTAALLQAFGRAQSKDAKPLQINVIESPDIPTVGVGEATTPGIVRTLQNAGLSEKEFFKRCNASFKLGVSFDGWNVDAKGKPISYINPFVKAPNIRGIEIANYFAKFGAGDQDYVGSYAITNDLVRGLKGPRTLGSKEYDQSTGFAYHLDAGRFAGLLTEHCKARGVRHIAENVLEVKQDESGNISELILDKTGSHAVELVIDCTGFRGLIINQVLKEPFIDYSKYLANDRAMAVQIKHKDQTKIEPVTRSTALGAGWSWRVPLYNRIGTGYVYSSAHRTDDEARDEFLAHLGNPEGAEPRIIPMRIGRNRNAWVKNCVAIGLSGGFIEPLESTAIYMIDLAVRWLLTYFPEADYADPLRDRYNKLVDNLYNEVRDFICVHYRLGNRTDSQYWIDAREELELPDGLAENLELWRYNLPSYYDVPFNTIFDAQVYAAVLMGKQVYKTGYAKGNIGAGLNLDQKLWREAHKQIRQNNLARAQRAADHRTLLAELRG
ncbi:Tryptophan halogenase [Candidatus Rhodobacter oscarellae]|uniref:Tryptophan halogenase n=1 Tax=Candidatus Rhodobacter oscarellae TaxID=1675527 RepID=A0A0J9H433_9RHOB